ncbi:pseudaminic acid cytidylyltransferase [Motilimonas cestriensis]|uniref:Pseudaminic acid cytidylyltransferase n=1 Tax=Motilimonas cestriensis TaxID=2742685 RepID=A0ABS8WCS6_9GAMM|nr:pseudaminic acid cytidylyltransferase [Motilimonas cestriensis]
MNLCVIPARGGSIRIPQKNIKAFCGKPIIAYSIEIAKASGLFDKIIVSTDDNEIAKVAKQYGAEVPFMRPAELSDDYTGTTPVVAHAIRFMEDQGYQIDKVCCIYATAPLLKVEYLKQGFNKLAEPNCEFCFSATTFDFPIQRAIRLLPEGGVEPMFPEHIGSRSQDLEEAYHDAGQFYWGTPECFKEGRSGFNKQAQIVHLPKYMVQDVDTLEDWIRLEGLFRHKSEHLV